MSGAGAGGGAGGAAGAAAAGGDAANGQAQQGQQGAEANGQHAAGLDPAALNATLEALQGGQEELRQLFQSQQQPPAQQPEGEPEGEDAFDLDGFDDLDGEGLPWDGDGLDGEPADVAEATATAVDTYLQAAMAPLARELSATRQQMSEMDLRSKINELVAGRPELGDPKVGAEVVEAARTLAEAHGMPELGGQPWLWGLVYDAMKAHQYAELEEGHEGADDAAAHLEGGGGATPGGGQQDPGAEWARRVAGMRRGSSVLPFG